jgi:adenosylmethionine-8-amino-7-oxononanoate aminotransferase
MTTLGERDQAYLWHPFTQHAAWAATAPLVIVRGEGCYLYDEAGNAYLDGVSSLWTNVHGHAHPRIDAAVRAQLDQLAHSTLLGLSHPSAILLAAALVHRMNPTDAPTGLRRVFFSDSGSTAAEVALKMAFQYQQQVGATGRTRFANLSGAYHGDTVGAVSVGAIPLFHEVYGPLLFQPVTLPAPVTPGGEEEDRCLHQALALLEAHGEALAAVIVEPLVQGAAGMKMHSAQFLAAIAAKAREVGALLIVDEVATGFGRTGTLFAYQQAQVAPDFVCVAKGLTGGYLPLAATLTTERVFEAFLAGPGVPRQFYHGHTYTGNPLACAAALASLEVFDDERTLDHVGRISHWITDALGTLAGPSVAAVRQRGVMVGIDVQRRDGRPFSPSDLAGARVCAAARPHGVLLRPLGDTLVWNPPLAVTEADVARLAAATRAGIEAVS